MPSGGQIQNISQLLSTNEQFVVPDFQRNYSWEQQQVEELFHDINVTASQQDSHFLGGLILLRNAVLGPCPFEVVDGQQRLTTLFLLIAAIRDVAVGLPVHSVPGAANAAPINPAFDAQALLYISNENGNTARFVAHPMIAAMVDTAVFPYPSLVRPKLPTRHLKYSLAMRKAYKQLLETVRENVHLQIDDEARVKYLHRLLDTIKYKLKILNVSSDNNSEAYEIFMTLNSRGLPLGPSDLVKSEIFKHLTRDLTGRELDGRNATLTSDWQTILTNLEDGDVDQFLRHYWLSRMRTPLTSKKIFDKANQFINKEGVDSQAQAQALLDELLYSSKLYKYLLENDSPDITGEESSLQLMQEITDSYRIFCLVAIDPRINLLPAERLELVRLCEVVVIRWVLAGQNAQVLENNLQELAMDLREGKDLARLSQKFKALIATDDKIVRVFEDTIENASMVRIVLYRINQRWDFNHMIRFDPKKMHVEHIAPDAPTDHWMNVLFPNDRDIDRQVEYESATELWGNKTILDAKINQEIKQKPFQEKKVGVTEILANGNVRHYKGYTDSPIEITKDLGANLSNWDRNLIAERNKWIAESFLKIWAVEPNFMSIKSFTNWLNEN